MKHQRITSKKILIQINKHLEEILKDLKEIKTTNKCIYEEELRESIKMDRRFNK